MNLARKSRGVRAATFAWIRRCAEAGVRALEPHGSRDQPQCLTRCDAQAHCAIDYQEPQQCEGRPEVEWNLSRATLQGDFMTHADMALTPNWVAPLMWLTWRLRGNSRLLAGAAGRA